MGPNLNFKRAGCMVGGLLSFLQTVFGHGHDKIRAIVGRSPMTIIDTSDAKKLRAYATRLMAFALKAVSDGDTDFAERLTARASECLDNAQATEGLGTDRPASSSSK
jgi:hypothetical protein